MLIDKARSALLADVGQPDYGAAVVVIGDEMHVVHHRHDARARPLCPSAVSFLVTCGLL